jgi:hypothetical protein
MEPPLPFPQPGRNRALLVADDPMTGAALEQELLALGADVFWARDSIEARWLWLPNFYGRSSSVWRKIQTAQKD